GWREKAPVRGRAGVFCPRNNFGNFGVDVATVGRHDRVPVPGLFVWAAVCAVSGVWFFGAVSRLTRGYKRAGFPTELESGLTKRKAFLDPRVWYGVPSSVMDSLPEGRLCRLNL